MERQWLVDLFNIERELWATNGIFPPLECASAAPLDVVVLIV